MGNATDDSRPVGAVAFYCNRAVGRSLFFEIEEKRGGKFVGRTPARATAQADVIRAVVTDGHKDQSRWDELRNDRDTILWIHKAVVSARDFVCARGCSEVFPRQGRSFAACVTDEDSRPGRRALKANGAVIRIKLRFGGCVRTTDNDQSCDEEKG